MNATTPAEEYEARAARHQVAEQNAARGARRLSVLRLVAAAGVVLAAVRALARAEAGAPAWSTIALGALCAAAFALLVRVHGRARREAAAHAERRSACARGAARVRRRWEALPEPLWARHAPADRLALVEDLHLAGRGSVAQLLDVVIPAVGGVRLIEWLVADPPSAATIAARQEAVRALARREELLEACAANAAAAARVSRRTVDAFVAWCEAPPSAPLGVLRRAWSWVGTALVAAGIGGVAAGMPGAAGWLGVALLLNASAAIALQRRLRALLGGVGDLPALLRPVLATAERFDAERFDAPQLGASTAAPAAWEDVQRRLRSGGGLRALGRLTALLRWSEVRYSPMGHWALNATVQWDVHLVAALERWRRAAGGSARAWLDAVGDGEALIALATLAHDNPRWAMPALVDDGPATAGASPVDVAALDAQGLGHPLLAESARVGNALALGGPGSVLVVSGSNMAGKTTLLRAIGLNVLLAQAGGPVCAAAMRWRRLRVRTSIRVQDALERGVSLYLAELQRLKSIVDDASADALGTAPAAPVLYLLDEVLHGTNSADRRTATRAILARLRHAGAVGIVTTHDLELADDPALAVDTAHVHFREQYEAGANGPRMTFDFVARPGRATSANALALLAVLGLDRAGRD